MCHTNAVHDQGRRTAAPNCMPGQLSTQYSCTQLLQLIQSWFLVRTPCVWVFTVVVYARCRLLCTLHVKRVCVACVYHIQKGGRVGSACQNVLFAWVGVVKVYCCSDTTATAAVLAPQQHVALCSHMVNLCQAKQVCVTRHTLTSSLHFYAWSLTL